MRSSGVLTGIGLLLLAAAQSHAGILYSTGFEDPPFAPGPVDGQGGWTVFSATGQTEAPVIESTLDRSGQALEIPGSTTGQTGPYLAPGYTGVLDMSADLYISSGTDETRWQFAAVGAGGVGFAGGIKIAGSTPDLSGSTIYALSGDGTTTLGTFTRDAWHRVDLLLDYPSQTYSVSLDGATIGSDLAFCGNNAFPCNGASVASLGWAFFDGYGDPSGNGDDVAAIDNFSIATVPVPEPGTLALFGAGIFGAALTRRRTRARSART